MVTLVLAPHAILFFAIALVITYFYGKRMPQLCYVLWLVVLLKLLIPLSYHDFLVADFQWPISNEESQEDSLLIQESISEPLKSYEAQPRPIHERFVSQQDTEKTIDLAKYLTLSSLFLFLWFGGSVYVLIRGVCFIRGVYRRLHHNRTIQKGAVYSLFLDCVKKMGLANIPRLVSTNYYDVPFGVGFWPSRMTVVLPAELLEKKDLSTLAVIFSHELSHIKKYDYFVNLFRFVVKILFHVHPICWIADRYIFHYQEITTDLFALRKMKISQPKYVDVLVNVLLGIDENNRKMILQSPLLTSHLSVYNRMDYVSDHVPFNRLAHIGSILIIVLLALSAFGTSITVYPHFYFEGILTLSEENSLYPFPEPVQTGISVRQHNETYAQYRQGLLWVIEPLYGIFAYTLEGTVQRVHEYSFPLVGSENKTNRINAFDFYMNTVYLAISSPQFFSNAGGQVDIVTESTNGNFVKVSEIKENSPRLVKAVGHYLWVGGFSEIVGEYYLAIYDIQNSLSPMFLDRVYSKYMPLTAETNESQTKLYISYENGIGIHRDPSSLEQSNFINTSSTPKFFKVLPDQRLLMEGISVRSFGGYDTYLSLLSNEEEDFEILSNYRVVHPSDSISADSLLVFDNSAILTYGNGIAFLRIDNNRLSLVSYKKGNYGGGVLGPQLLLTNPVFYYVDLSELNNLTVQNWKLHE